MKHRAASFMMLFIVLVLCWGMTSCASSGYKKAMKNYRPDDAAAAVRELSPLAEQGDAQAQFSLGSLYYQGSGVPQDYKEAVKWLTKAAEQRHVHAEMTLGGILTDGVQGVIPKDYPQALMWFIFAAAQGDKEAVEFRDNLAMKMTPVQITTAQRLAREFKPADTYTKFYRLLRPLAEQGDSTAQFKLALLFYNGRGVAHDYSQALDWFKKAARQGHPLAQFNAGYMYENGEGTPQDYLEAAKCYRESAERGNQLAQYNLGYLYEKGRGVPQDEVQALLWYNLAAIQGEAKAKTARERVTVWMTPAQIADAQRLAREFKKK